MRHIDLGPKRVSCRNYSRASRFSKVAKVIKQEINKKETEKGETKTPSDSPGLGSFSVGTGPTNL